MYTPEKPAEIHQLEEQNSVAITKLILEKGLPENDRSTPLQIYSLSDHGLRKSQIGPLLDELVPRTTKSLLDADRTLFRQNIRHICYALIGGFYRFEWLALSTRDVHYQKDQRLGKLGFSRRRVESILDVLVDEGYAILGRKGFRHWSDSTQSKASQYFPTSKLISYFMNCLYELAESTEQDCYHKFNDFEPNTEPPIGFYEANESLLKAYNKFMSNHWWAKKGPTVRSFSTSVNRGGRLHTGYQTIVNRRLPIRSNTLLDGEPIAEPDFSANHVRMACALFGEQLPLDPYSEIATRLGCGRPAVKAFVTRVMGATSRKQKGGQIQKLLTPSPEGLDADLYRELESEFYREYPFLHSQKVFFNDTSARMQLLEGEIGLKMFDWAMNESMPILSVHDSFAVRQRDKEITWAAMQEFWQETIKEHQDRSPFHTFREK